jgi:hypothetical protein
MNDLIALKDEIMNGSASPFEKGAVVFGFIILAAGLLWFFAGRNKTV